MEVCEAKHCTGINSSTTRLKDYNINKALIKLQVAHCIESLQNAIDFHCTFITVTALLFAYKLRAKPKWNVALITAQMLLIELNLFWTRYIQLIQRSCYSCRHWICVLMGKMSRCVNRWLRQGQTTQLQPVHLKGDFRRWESVCLWRAGILWSSSSMLGTPHLFLVQLSHKDSGMGLLPGSKFFSSDLIKYWQNTKRWVSVVLVTSELWECVFVFSRSDLYFYSPHRVWCWEAPFRSDYGLFPNSITVNFLPPFKPVETY